MKVKCPRCGISEKVHNMGQSDGLDAEINYFCQGCGYIWRIPEQENE